MSVRDEVLACLRDGGRTFPMIHRRLGGTRQRVNQALALMLKAGLIERTGERRHYVYTLPGRVHEDGKISPESTGADLQAVWR